MKKFFKTHAKLCIAVLALALVTVGGTLALMATSPKTLLNSFTAADVDTQIEETLTDGDKKVTIKNNGPSDAYVRARIMVSGVNPDNQVEIISDETKAADPNKVYLVMNYNDESEGRWCKENSSQNNDYSDDFYYYLGVLPDDGSTEELLSKVIIGENLKNEEFLEQFTVTVYHESVLAIEKPDIPEAITLKMVTDSFKNAVPTATPGT